MLTAVNGCGSDTYTDTLYLYSVNLEEGKDRSPIAVYPNPSNGMISIAFPKGFTEPCNVRINDASGRCILSKDVMPAELPLQTIDISAFSSGLYILEVSAQSTLWKIKIMKY